MAVETYNLVAADLETRWPQHVTVDDTNGPATAARLNALIASACAVVNGILATAGIDTADVAADAQAKAATLEYVYAELLPHVLLLMREDPDAIRDAADAARSALGRLRANPRSIGLTSDTAVSPRLSTSTGSLGLAVDETSMLQRRRYAGGRRANPRHNRFHW